MTQVRRLRYLDRVGGIIGRVGPNGDSGVWSIHDRASDPYYSSVSLLLHMDGTNGSTTFTDSGPQNRTLTAGNGAGGSVAISTTQAQFGQSALFTPNAWLSQSADMRFTGDYTLELWIYPARVNVVQVLFNTGAESSGRVVFYLDSSGNLVIDRFGVGVLMTSSSGLSANVWSHIAWCRIGITTRMFINGSLVGTNDTNTNLHGTLGNATSFRIGAANNGLSGFSGHMDEYRITRGIARYRSAFVVPPRAFLP